MKKLLFGLTTVMLITIIALGSCKDSKRAQFNALGKPHIITLLGCTGDTLRKWEVQEVYLMKKDLMDGILKM